jgi:hypothetical protein
VSNTAPAKKQKKPRKPSTMQAARDADVALNDMADAHERVIGIMRYVFNRLAELEQKDKDEKDAKKQEAVELPKTHTFGQFKIPAGSRLSRWD